MFVSALPFPDPTRTIQMQSSETTGFAPEQREITGS
jgi:hypothetical protein